MRAARIIDLLHTSDIERLCAVHKVDKGVKKHFGPVILKLLIFCLLTERKASLRTMEALYHSAAFKQLSGLGTEATTRHSSFSERLSHIPAAFFKDLFTHCLQQFAPVLKAAGITHHLSGIELIRIDSTIIELGRVVEGLGIKGGHPIKSAGGHHRAPQVKVSLGFNGLLPLAAKVCAQECHCSEEVTLSELIASLELPKDSVVVFDRGLQSRKHYQTLLQRQAYFVGRLKSDPACLSRQDSPVAADCAGDDHLEIVADFTAQLKGNKKDLAGGVMQQPLRVVHYRLKSSGKCIWVVTNLMELPPAIIAKLYRHRWDIEVYIRFLKQELNLSHSVSRTQNGLEVVTYVRLITAILLTVYSQTNGIKSYKQARMRFSVELENELITQIVRYCGGNPDLFFNGP
jgi:hypothetical protein